MRIFPPEQNAKFLDSQTESGKQNQTEANRNKRLNHEPVIHPVVVRSLAQFERPLREVIPVKDDDEIHAGTEVLVLRHRLEEGYRLVPLGQIG